MTPTPGITALLRHARQLALQELSGQPATLGADGTLAIAAGIMRDAVIAQAAAGLWVPYGVTEPDHIRGLVVTCAFGDVARGEPAIKIEWDFSRTRLAGLVVESTKEGSN